MSCRLSNLPDKIQDHFLKGEHTVRFKPGYANAISGDNAAESSYMLYGKSVNGIVGDLFILFGNSQITGN